MSEIDDTPRASTLRRILVSSIAVVVSVVFGFLYGLFGYYAISYWAFFIGLCWAVAAGGIVRVGKLTHPDFTLPLGLFLAAVVLVVAMLTAYDWIESDVRSDFDQWLEVHHPDSSRDESWQHFMAEAMNDEHASGGVVGLFRYKAYFGEQHTRQSYRETFQRRGFWAWLCWVVITLALPVFGVSATLIGSFSAHQAGKPGYGIRTHLRGRRKRAKAVPEKPEPATIEPPSWTHWKGVARALVSGYWQFILPISVTFLASLLSPQPGRGMFIAFAVSALWVSAAFAAMEPERDEFSWKRLGGHFINLTAMLAMMFVAMFMMMPVIILTAGLDSDIALYLYLAGTFVALARLWPIYTMRYLYRGEDNDPALDQRGWGFDVISAWRLTRAPGCFWRCTFWALGSAFVLISIHDYGYLHFPDSLQTLWNAVGLGVLLPLGHLVIAERAIALRDVQEIDAVLSSPIAEPDVDADEEFYERVDDSVARQATSMEEAERLQDFMNAVPAPLIKGGDALVEYAREQQDEMVEKKGRRNKKHFMIFGIRLKRFDWIQRALDKGLDIDAWIELDMPPMVYASGSTTVQEYLLDQGADIEGKDKRDRTALWHCAESNSVDSIRMLLSRGANPNIVDQHGQSAMVAACQRNRVDAARLLAEAGVDLNQVNPHGENLLTLAASRGHLEMVGWLIDQGLPIDRKVESDDWIGEYTALWLAVRSGHFDVARALVEAGADCHSRLSRNQTLLMESANYGHTDMCLWLINQGIDPNARDDNGFDAVVHAEYQDRPKTHTAEAIAKHPRYRGGR